MTPATRHHNTSWHEQNSRIVQQLCPCTQIQWKSQTVLGPSKTESRGYKTSP